MEECFFTPTFKSCNSFLTFPLPFCLLFYIILTTRHYFLS